VKGTERGPAGRTAICAPKRAPKQSAAEFSVNWIRSSRFQTFFTWQNGCDYRQCTSIKAPFV
jgi:hypothetical protein